ncbi:MAG: hypothetical protein GXP49_15980 [Deltaproteobacteria bacterium]|nr:hypothetical protein [Deltaproteobacteria bacterium]
MSVELKPTPSPATQNEPLVKVIFLIQVLIVAGLIGLAVSIHLKPKEERIDTERVRAVASRLKAAGILDQAGELYEKYLQSKGEERGDAKIAYSLADLYMERGDYEKALRWLYEADELGPGNLKEEVGKKIVHALEALGRVHAAQAALDSRTRLDTPGPASKEEDDPVVAEIGKDKIRRSRVMQALDDLPPFLRQRFSGADGPARFLRKYVADELLFRKAKKLEYDKDPQVKRRLQDVLKQLVAARFIEKEISSKLHVDEADLRNYFKAHRKDYDVPDQARIRLIKVSSKKEALALKKKIEKGMSFAKAASRNSLDEQTKKKGGLLDKWVKKGENFLGQGDPRVVSDVIFNTPVGKVSDPTPAGNDFYLFLTEKKKKGKKIRFEDVKNRVEQDYKVMKSTSMYQDMLKEAMSAEQVKLHPEKLGGDK